MSFLKASKTDIINRIIMLCTKLGEDSDATDLQDLGKEELIRTMVRLEDHLDGRPIAPLAKKRRVEGISNFDVLPDEMVEHILKIATTSMDNQRSYEFLTEVIPQVSKRFKIIATTKSLWKGLAPFEMLPDELAEIPIRMAMKHKRNTEYNYLVDTIAKVSSRFKNFATCKSLWKEPVFISTTGETGDKNIKELTQEFFHDDMKVLTLTGIGTNPTISAHDIKNIALKCPKLRDLGIFGIRVDSWPTLADPWTSLRTLFLGCTLPVGPKKNFFHRFLPNLKTIKFGETIGNTVMLPDMKECKKLKRIQLAGGKFVVTGLPRNLSELKGHDISRPTIVSMNKASLEELFDDCLIDSKINFENENA